MSEKIVLEQKVRVKKKSGRRKRWLLIATFIFSLILIGVGSFAVYAVVLPAQRVYNSAQNILAITDGIKLDLDSKDLTKLDTHIAAINSELASIDAELSNYDFLKDLEITKGYYDNLQVVREIASKGESLINTNLPELKVLLGSVGYKVDAEIDVDQPDEEDQVQALISEMPRVLGLYNDTEPEIIELLELVGEINPQYIPAIGTGGTREKLIEFQGIIQEFPSISAQVKTTLRQLPELLGAEEPTTYLLILQNEKEMRSSGGLLTAYGTMTVDKGELVGDIDITDMWDLELYVSSTLGIDAGHRNIYGQLYLMNPIEELNYGGCGSTYLRAQDAGIYPDLYVTADTVTDYYDIANAYNPQKYPGYDHVIIANTFFASDLVSLIEPLAVPGFDGQEITSTNIAKVIYGETSEQVFDPATRKLFIGEVATAAKESFIDLPSEKFPDLVKTIISTIQAKNISFYSEDIEMQAYFDELGLSGRIEQNFAGDYFTLSEAQVCSLKANFYVEDAVTQNIKIEQDGKISKNVEVNWKNEKVYDRKEEKIISKSPNFGYRAWVRVVTPKGTEILDSTGLKSSGYLWYYPKEYFDDVLQKQVSDNIITFDHRMLTDADPIRS